MTEKTGEVPVRSSESINLPTENKPFVKEKQPNKLGTPSALRAMEKVTPDIDDRSDLVELSKATQDLDFGPSYDRTPVINGVIASPTAQLIDEPNSEDARQRGIKEATRHEPAQDQSNGGSLIGENRTKAYLSEISLQIAKMKEGFLPQSEFQKFVSEAKELGVSGDRIRSLLESQGVRVTDSKPESEIVKPKGLTTEQILDIEQKATQKARELNQSELNNLFDFNEAVDESEFDLQTARDRLEPETGKQFEAHGIDKGSNLKALVDLLDNGIDPTRPFNTMNLQGTLEENSTVGMGAAHPYDTGGFIILGEPNGHLTQKGIKGVLVNKQYYDALPQLQQAYPDIRWIKAGEMNKELTTWVNETQKSQQKI